MSEGSDSGNDSSDSDSSSSDGRSLSGKKSDALSAQKPDGNTRANAAEKTTTDSGTKVEKSGSKQPSSEAAPSAEVESIPRSVRGSGDSSGSGDSGDGDDSSGAGDSE
jgi:hypothetical protein